MARLAIPPEWSPQTTICVGWPSIPSEWGDALGAVQAEVAALVRALSAHAPVIAVAGDKAGKQAAYEAVGDIAEIRLLDDADIWLRDTAPLFGTRDGQPAALGFHFNGWGGKYDRAGDRAVAPQIAPWGPAPFTQHDLTLEGGALEFDGAGTLVTTRDCVLGDTRNPGLSETDVTRMLSDTFEIDRVIWLDRGLVGDHTDGHVDNTARFVAPGLALVQRPSGDDDPQFERLIEIDETLRAAGLTTVAIPSPGPVEAADGAVLPASHLNFIMCNGAIIVPVYEDTYSTQALIMLQRLFRGREVIPLRANTLLEVGGGAFHCLSREIPALIREPNS